MKKSVKKYFILYISLCVFTLSLITVMSGCAIQSMINAVNPAAFHPPKWDLKVEMPIMEKTLKMTEFMDPESMFGAMLSGIGNDASFDKVTAEDLAEGGKYHYPNVKYFGLNVGDYVINYKVDFPGTDTMSQGLINDSVIDQFINNFVFEIDNLWYWPWPLGGEMPISISSSTNTASLAALPNLSDVSVDNQMRVPLDLTVDIDNTNDPCDIILKGIHCENASMTINFVVEKYKDGVVEKTIVPSSDEIIMEYIVIEDTTYDFGEPTRVDEGDKSLWGLKYPAKNFITEEKGSHNLMFNGTVSDGRGEYADLNVDGFKFTMVTPKSFTQDDAIKAMSDKNNGYKYRLRISVGIDFGDSYDIICTIKELTFDLGCIESDLSMLNLLDGTDDKENLGSYFVSNMSLANAGIYFDAKSTLPIQIDLRTLFDGIDNLLTGPPNMPRVEGGKGYGSTLTWFKEPNGVDYTAVSLKYNDDCTNDAFIPPIGKDGGFSTKKFGLYNDNSNMKDFLERTDANENLQRASKLFFVSSFKTNETTDDVYLPIKEKLGGVQIQAGFLMPISMRVPKDKEPMDVLKALGMGNMIVSLADSMNNLPVQINDLGFRITCENKLPVGIVMDFCVTADETVDGKSRHYLVKMVEGNNKIPTGNYINKEGSYRVAGSHTEEITAAAKMNFSYNLQDDDGNTIDMSGDLSADAKYNYDGTLFKFISEHKDTAAMQVKIGLLETDSGDNEIAVKLRDDNYLKLKLDLLGSTTFDLSNMATTPPVEEDPINVE